MLSVVGNRPQFIKSGPVSEALRDAKIEEVVLHTGQHYDDELSQVFFDELGLGEPKYRLSVGGLGRDRMLESLASGLADTIAKERPDWVLVYGDTNSTLGGARAAAQANVPLAHVEAGLRSYDDEMPEEHNRIETDRLSQLLLRPGRALAEDARTGRCRRPGRGDGRRDGGRVLPPGADRARAIVDPGHPRGQTFYIRGGDIAPRGECRRAATFADFAGIFSDRDAGRVPGASADDVRDAPLGESDP